MEAASNHSKIFAAVEPVFDVDSVIVPVQLVLCRHKPKSSRSKDKPLLIHVYELSEKYGDYWMSTARATTPTPSRGEMVEEKQK